MGIVKLTFDGAMNEAKMEAAFNSYLNNYENGIIYGLGDNLDFTIGNGKITFKSGYISVYGRRAFIEDGTEITIALDSTKFGYVVIEINTITNTVELKKLEMTGVYPSLTRTNLLKSDGIYQLPICAYSKSTTSLQNTTSFIKPYIQTAATNLTEMKNSILLETKKKLLYRSSYSSNTFVFDLGAVHTSDSLIIIPINYKFIVTLPGDMMAALGSIGSVYYTNGLTTFTLQFHMNSDRKLFLTTGSTTHNISLIYFYN